MPETFPFECEYLPKNNRLICEHRPTNYLTCENVNKFLKKDHWKQCEHLANRQLALRGASPQSGGRSGLPGLPEPVAVDYCSYVLGSQRVALFDTKPSFPREEYRRTRAAFGLRVSPNEGGV